MKIAQETHGMVTLLELEGNLSPMQAQKLQQSIDDLLKLERIFIILDLEKVEYIDSQALLILLRCNREILAAGGAIKLLHPGRVIKRFLSLGKVLELFERFETKIEVISSFRTFIERSKKQPDPQEVQCRNQRRAILRLTELLIEKGHIDLDSFALEFNRSSQLIMDVFRKEYGTEVSTLGSSFEAGLAPEEV